MRGIVSRVEVINPKTANEAAFFLEQESKAGHTLKILAGATDIGVEFNAGKLTQTKLMNIWCLRSELSFIKQNESGVEIGALTTFSEIQESKVLQKYFPSLVAASKLVGGVQIQNRGTIGGNIANASPAGDSLPALCAYDAILTLKSRYGLRKIPISQFYKGYKNLDLRSDELLVSVALKFPQRGAKHYFRKVGTRQAQAISKVVASGLAVTGAKGVIKNFTFSLGSVGPFTLRCQNVEKFIKENSQPKKSEQPKWIESCLNELSKDISPRDDIRSTKSYREFVSRSLLKEFLREIDS